MVFQSSGSSGDPRLYCPRCGERIGIYEQLGLEQPDGTVCPSSYLNLNSDQLDAGIRLWHWHCVAPVPIPDS